MTEPVIVFDSGVIDQVVANRAFRAVVEDLLRVGWTPIIPAPVLAEAITGRATDAPTNQAIVAAHAVEAGAGVVFTTDPRDLQRLLAGTPRVRVETP